MTREQLLEKFTVGVKFQPIDNEGQTSVYFPELTILPDWKLFVNSQTGNAWFECFGGHLGMAHWGYVQVGELTAKILEP